MILVVGFLFFGGCVRSVCCLQHVWSLYLNPPNFLSVFSFLRCACASVFGVVVLVCATPAPSAAPPEDFCLSPPLSFDGGGVWRVFYVVRGTAKGGKDCE